MTPTPVRTPAGPLHVSKPTGRGYRTACGRTLSGAHLVVPDRVVRTRFGRRIDGWARAWALELVCRQCDRILSDCDTESDLARRAHW